ncbi:hypothetical protein LMG8286_01784 [Campylobacter suis]|uniref:DUF2314 domain-containing protein n=1 Tax=Campylobacter suis TaxID=2790657 RepID=A0ABM8Q9F9_9BACT|nr:hypothetical protein LMG8286_01784 [Campylobacter suis]
MFGYQGRAYRAFSAQAIRSEMSEQERAEYYEAWGFEFGDFNDILVVVDQKQSPQNLTVYKLR